MSILRPVLTNDNFIAKLSIDSPNLETHRAGCIFVVVSETTTATEATTEGKWEDEDRGNDEKTNIYIVSNSNVNVQHEISNI